MLLMDFNINKKQRTVGIKDIKLDFTAMEFDFIFTSFKS